MIFSAHFWPFALLWATIAAGASIGLSLLGRKTGSLKAAATVTFVVSLFAVRFLMYYVQPSFMGSFGGYFLVLLFALVPAVAITLVFLNVSGDRYADGPHASAYWAAALFALVMIVVPILQYTTNAWGGKNAARLADLPKIRIAAPEEKMPPTDPNRMVLVTRSMAIYKGQTALSTETGIASRYGINEDTYVLQHVQGHRYWIAPLRPINSGDTFWTPLTGGRATSPGYVVVDAENPSRDAWLKLGFEISLFEDLPWSMKLTRFVYQRGYQHGLLEEPIFEVDDDWQPHYTITYVKRAFGNIVGQRAEKVIAVSVAKGEPRIEEYALDNKPKWIDRVMSEGLVRDYADHWGMYGGEFARKNFWSVFWGINRTGTMQSTELELSYTRDDHNVWVIPMTSTNEADHTVVGVLVFESGHNEGTFYPGIKGFNEPSSVDETMVNARDNIKHYPVEAVQLYNIYGELTWVAMYAAPQQTGKSFGGIGMLHAHSQDAADVIYANDKQTALRQYATQLARRSDGAGDGISQFAKESKEVTGRIVRIAPLPSTQLGGSPTYMFIVDTDNHTFVISRDTYMRIPLVKEGDVVSFKYLETDSSETAVNHFRCRALDKQPVGEKQKDSAN